MDLSGIITIVIGVLILITTANLFICFFHLCADELRKYDMCGIMHNVRKKKSHREAVDYEYKYYLDCRG